MLGNSEKTKIRQAFSAAAHGYDQVAQLQREVGLQLLQHLDANKITGRIVDLGCGTGFLTAELLKGRPGQPITALDLAVPMLRMARSKLNAKTISYVCADAENLPFADASLDLVVSNLALQWCGQLDQALADICRALKPGGSLAFSTFGDGTLQELKNAWATVDSHRHVNAFYDRQRLLQAVQEAGFSDIQSHSRRYQPRYGCVLDLLKELKQLGARTVVAGHSSHLTGKQKMQTMMAAYQRLCGAQITASFHVITLTATR